MTNDHHPPVVSEKFKNILTLVAKLSEEDCNALFYELGKYREESKEG